MIWTTWRQHRAEAGVAAVILIALASAMLVLGSVARDRARALGLPACTATKGDCARALESLHRDFHSLPPFTAALIAVPLLAGMFWGAPLVSREYEAGTHRLAWTQSISPRGWIVTKLALIFGVLAASAVGLGLLATWALAPLTPAFSGRFNSTWYDTQGLVPVACMVFALAVGVAASGWIRRTIPAMAVTLFVYAAARIPIHWIRWHFAPVATHTVSAPLTALLQDPSGDPQSLFAPTTRTGDWVVGTKILDPSGHLLGSGTGNREVLLHYCPDLPRRGAVSDAARAACAPHLKGTVRAVTDYQPASHFWLMQAVESAIFLGAAAVLVTVAVLAVTRRRPT